jgi:hypothetical protein
MDVRLPLTALAAVAALIVPTGDPGVSPARAHALARQVLASPFPPRAFADLRLDERLAVWHVLTDVRPAGATP